MWCKPIRIPTKVIAAMENLELLVVQEILWPKRQNMRTCVIAGRYIFGKSGTYTNAERRAGDVQKWLSRCGNKVRRADYCGHYGTGWALSRRLMKQTPCWKEISPDCTVFAGWNGKSWEITANNGLWKKMAAIPRYCTLTSFSGKGKVSLFLTGLETNETKTRQRNILISLPPTAGWNITTPEPWRAAPATWKFLPKMCCLYIRTMPENIWLARATLVCGIAARRRWILKGAHYGRNKAGY